MSNKVEFDDFHAAVLFILNTTMHSFIRLKEIDKKIATIIHENGLTTDTDPLLMDTYTYCNDVIIRIATLFDKDSRTLSLYVLEEYILTHLKEIAPYFCAEFGSIRGKHNELIQRIIRNRNGVIAHLGKNPLREARIEAQELITLPIEPLLEDIQELLETLYAKYVISLSMP